MKTFATKEMPESDFSELCDLVSKNVPSLAPRIAYLKGQMNDSITCPSEWSRLLNALSSPSAVCGLVHPSEELFSILRRIPSEDITKDMTIMEALQASLKFEYVVHILLTKIAAKLGAPNKVVDILHYCQEYLPSITIMVRNKRVGVVIIV